MVISNHRIKILGCILILAITVLACSTSNSTYDAAAVPRSPSPTASRTPRPTFIGEAEATVQSVEVNLYLTQIAADQVAHEAQQTADAAAHRAKVAADLVTAQAAATYEALKVEGTRRAMDIESTRQAMDIQSTVSAATATAEAQAAATEHAQVVAAETAQAGATSTARADTMSTATAQAGAISTQNAQATAADIKATRQGIANLTATAEALDAEQRRLEHEREELWLSIARVLLPVGQAILVIVGLLAGIGVIYAGARSVPAWIRTLQLRARKFNRDKAGRVPVFAPEFEYEDGNGEIIRAVAITDPSIAFNPVTVIGDEGVHQPQMANEQMQMWAVMFRRFVEYLNEGRWPYPGSAGNGRARPRPPANPFGMWAQTMGQGGVVQQYQPPAIPAALRTEVVEPTGEVGHWIEEVEGKLVEEGY